MLTLTWGFLGKDGPRILVAWFLHETFSDGIINWACVVGRGWLHQLLLQYRILIRKLKQFFYINIKKNAKEKLSLGFWVTEIKTDTAGAHFSNSLCNKPHHPPPQTNHQALIGLMKN